MTDARYPERWLSDRRLLRLGDRDHRAFITTLAWSVSNRTDGLIEHEDLALVPGAHVESAAALVAAGLWATCPQGWRISVFAGTQTSAHELEVLENGRRREREKKARQRGKTDSPGPDRSVAEPVPRDVPGDVFPGDGPRGLSPGTPQARPVPEIGRLEGHYTNAKTEAADTNCCTVCAAPLTDPVARRTGCCSRLDAAHQAAKRAS